MSTPLKLTAGLMAALFTLGATGIISKYFLPAHVYMVSPDGGAQYTKFCDADCTEASASRVCASDSAMGVAQAAYAADPTISQEIILGPGDYDECGVVNSVKNLKIRGAGIDATILRPSVSVLADLVSCGAFVIAANNPDTGSKDQTTNIELSNMTIHSDGWNAPLAGLFIGDCAASNPSIATWDDIYVHDVKIIGLHDSFQWMGTYDTTEDDLPTLRAWNVDAVGGRDGIQGKAAYEFYGDALFELTQTNYCESTDATLLAAHAGTAQAGGSTTTVVLDPNEGSTISDGFVGRSITLATGTCAAGGKCWITDFDVSDPNVPTVTCAPALGFSPDATCDYTIAAVPNVDTPCKDIDWTIIAAQDTGGGTPTFGYWTTSGFRMATATASIIPGGIFQALNSRVRIDVNDFGPHSVAHHIIGAGEFGSNIERIEINANVAVNLNVDLHDGMSALGPFAVGVTSSQTSGAKPFTFTGTVRLNNVGEDDEIISVVRSSSANRAVYVPWAYLDLINTGGTATANHLRQTAGTLGIGRVWLGQTASTSGTITSLDTLP